MCVENYWCVQDVGGEYASADQCVAECKVCPDTPDNVCDLSCPNDPDCWYACDPIKGCVQADGGQYSTIAICDEKCATCWDDNKCNPECPNDPDCRYSCDPITWCTQNDDGEFVNLSTCNVWCDICEDDRLIQEHGSADDVLCCPANTVWVDTDDDGIADDCACINDGVCDSCPIGIDPDCRYDCDATNGCVQNDSWEYTSEWMCTDQCNVCWDDGVCNEDCNGTDPDCRYTCHVTQWCIQDDTGEYSSLNTCSEACGECWNGVLEGKEECDDGDKNWTSQSRCTIVCTKKWWWWNSGWWSGSGWWPNYCGDWILSESRWEACDDGNYVNWDGCSSVCTIEDNGVKDLIKIIEKNKEIIEKQKIPLPAPFELSEITPKTWSAL